MSNPTYSLTIGNQQLGKYLEQDTWSITQNFGRQGTTAHFQLFDDWGNNATSDFSVLPLSTLTFTDTAINKVLFSGYVTRPGITSYTTSAQEWLLDCVDYTSRSDYRVVFGDFNGLSADAMLISLVQQAYPTSIDAHGNTTAGLYAYSTNAPNLVPQGVTGAYVQPGPTLGRVQIPYMALTDAIIKICRLSSQQVDYSWFIDYNRNVHFFSVAQVGLVPVATFTDSLATLASNSLSPTLGTIQGDANTFQYLWDGTTVRNSAIVRGSNVVSQKTDVFIGNSLTSQWALSYSLDESVSQPTLRVNGVVTACTVVTSNQLPPTNAWYITPNAVGVWVLQAPAPPGIGAVVNVTYFASQPIITQQDNTVSQQRYADSNGAGIYQVFLQDPTLTTLSSATARALGELQEYQWVQERIRFTTSESWPGHVNAGDIIRITSARIPDSQNNYRMGLDGYFLIIQNTISGKMGNFRTYAITATRVK